MLADCLRDDGYCVLQAATGDEALILLASGVPCDLVVSDVRMPGKTDGLALLRHSKLEHPDLPFIVVSGHLLGVDAVHADGFFSKPYDFSELVAAVEQLIETRR